eukprot:3110851-Pleurochrysis_carterae.AAC.1
MACANVCAHTYTMRALEQICANTQPHKYARTHTRTCMAPARACKPNRRSGRRTEGAGAQGHALPRSRWRTLVLARCVFAQEWDAHCGDCGAHFAACVVSGKAILSPHDAAMCRSCKH